MYSFDYHKPDSIAAAITLLDRNPEAQILAGGHTLIPTLKQRLAQPTDLVDLGGIAELQEIREEGGKLVIGAMATHGSVTRSDLVRSMIPGLAGLAAVVGDAQVKNRGTIGGSIANNDPAADYPGAVVGLKATVRTTKREIPGDDFFLGLFETALDEGEIITAVVFPKPERSAYAKFRNPASRYALVGSMVAQTGGETRVAITGAGPTVFRWREAETALAASFAPEAVEGLKAPAADLNSDIHASAEYRAHLIGVMTKRAVRAALEGAEKAAETR